jgi:putative ABC transport system permease protein
VRYEGSVSRRFSAALPSRQTTSMVGTTSRQRFNMLLLTIFGASGLLMAAIGVYGLMAYSVQQRTQELGVRMALGAPASNIRNMVLRQGMAWDSTAFVVTPLLLSSVALTAIWIPARRATRVDPMTALRFE